MRFLPVSSKAEASALLGSPLLAVDMGISGSSKSCGVAQMMSAGPIGQKHYFSDAIRTVADFFRSHKGGVLILEAPLSAAFDKDGNPCARGDFEKVGKPRWWNLRAGASMALASLHFCHRLRELLPQDIGIQLVEGFVVGQDSVDHDIVAARLAEAFHNPEGSNWHVVAGDGHAISILEWLGAPGTACPIVLAPVSTPHSSF